MKIAYFDHRPAYRKLKPHIDEAIARVLESERLILGPECEALEREFAAYTGTAAAVGVASGTDALTLALRALDVGAGDEVITVANAGVPPVAAVRAAGATPRFVDVDPLSLLIDPGGLESARNRRTRCVLVVHLYGQPVPLEPILAWAGRHGCAVVEDCAQAHGATHLGRHVGSFGSIGCFSFYPTKNLGAFGDAGMCVTSDPRLAERLRMLRQYGWRGDRHAHCEGVNSRLDELQAAILRVRLRHLDAALVTRRELAARYLAGLAGSEYRPTDATPQAGHARHLFVVQAPDRARAIEALREASIGHAIHYPEPVHLMEAYRFLGGGRGQLPVTEDACGGVLSLPLYEGLAPSHVEQVVHTLLGAR